MAFRRMFELYDTDRSQKLDQTELRQMMQKITPSHINVSCVYLRIVELRLYFALYLLFNLVLLFEENFAIA